MLITDPTPEPTKMIWYLPTETLKLALVNSSAKGNFLLITSTCWSLIYLTFHSIFSWVQRKRQNPKNPNQTVTLTRTGTTIPKGNQTLFQLTRMTYIIKLHLVSGTNLITLDQPRYTTWVTLSFSWKVNERWKVRELFLEKSRATFIVLKKTSR